MNIKTILIALPLLALACSEEPVTSTGTFENYVGVWVPYEIKYEDGIINNGPFKDQSIFGVYYESLQLNQDKTYFPVNWTNAIDYKIKTVEKGSFEYLTNGNKLSFKAGAWDMDFKITKYEGDDLWIEYLGEASIPGKGLFKLKREL